MQPHKNKNVTLEMILPKTDPKQKEKEKKRKKVAKVERIQFLKSGQF